MNFTEATHEARKLSRQYLRKCYVYEVSEGNYDTSFGYRADWLYMASSTGQFLLSDKGAKLLGAEHNNFHKNV